MKCNYADSCLLTADNVYELNKVTDLHHTAFFIKKMKFYRLRSAAHLFKRSRV